MNRRCQIKTLILYFLCIIQLSIHAQNKVSKIDSNFIDSLFDVGYTLEFTNTDSAIKIYQTTAELSKSIGDELRNGKSYHYMGIVNSDLGEYESALQQNRLAIDLFEKVGYDIGIAATKINTGNIYLYLGESEDAIKLYYEGIRIYEELKDTARLLASYNNIGTLFYNNNYLDESLEYNKSALKLAKQLGDETYLADVYTNFANIMFLKELDDQFLQYIDSAIFFANSSGYVYGKVLAYNSLGNFYTRLEKYDSSKVYFKLAMNNAEQHGNPYNIAETYNLVGKSFMAGNELDSATHYLEKSYRIASEKGYQQIKAIASLNRSEVYSKEKKYNKAYETLLEHLQIFSKLQAQEKQHSIQELEKKYQVAKKEQQIKQQELMLELNNQELKRKNILITAGITFSLLAMLIVVLLLVLMNKRKIISEKELEKVNSEKEKQVIKALLEGEDKERKRIARELHDGVNGNLSVLKLNLSSLQNTEYNKLLDDTMDDIRTISHNLMPDVVRKFGLKEAFNNYISSIKKNSDLNIHFHYISDNNKIDDELAVNIYRVAQELVKNCIEHAGASELLIQISANKDMLQLTIEDDGIGFKPDKIGKTSENGQGIGLANVKNRVSYHMGSFEINSSTHSGTSFNIEIPLNSRT